MQNQLFEFNLFLNFLSEFVFTNLIFTHSIFYITTTFYFSVSSLPGRLKFNVDLDEREPDWHVLPVINCILLSYEFPNSLQEVISGVSLKQKQLKSANIQMAKKAFSKGVERVVYYGRDLTSAIKIVLKKSIDQKGSFPNSFKDYEASIQLQTIAAYMAALFTKELIKKVG